MAIDATSIDSSAAASRPVQRERAPSPVISDGHNGGPVEIKGEMSFWDVLDVINPLQHIPIVSTIYRGITGDTIQPAARVMGGMLFGGPLGGMASIANAVIEEAQGQDIGDQIMSSLGFGGGAHPTDSVAVAAATGGPATAGSPGEPQIAQAGSPIKLTNAPPSLPATPAASLAAQLAGTAPGAAPQPSKMPTRDTPLANSMMAKHAAPKFAAPLPGSILANSQAAAVKDPAQTPANQAPANANALPSPDMLSETMMRNLSKYEQSRKAAQSAAQSAAPAMRVSS